MGRPELLTSADRLDLQDKNSWRPENVQIIAQMYDCESTEEFAQEFKQYIEEVVSTSKITIALGTFFERRLREKNLI